MATHAYRTPAPAVQAELLPAVAAGSASTTSALDRMCADAAEAVLGTLAPHAGAPLLPPEVCPTAVRTADVRHGAAEPEGYVTTIPPFEGMAATTMPSEVCATVEQTPLLPPAAPLPPLAAALSRRRAIFGAVALAAAPVAALPAAAAVSADPADTRLVEIHQTSTELQGYFDRDDVTDKTADEAYDKICDMRVEAFDLRASTPAGALASLEMARDEFNRYYIEKSDDSDWLDRFTLKMMDNAIAVLRSVAHA